jgi:MFS transporter, ACS family, 4-hydroxyphenylacetate permease
MPQCSCTHRQAFPASDRTDPGLRVELQRCQPAGAWLGHDLSLPDRAGAAGQDLLSSAPTREATDPSDPVVRKVFRRLMWFLFVLLVVAFIDRINIGFAALTMNRDLGLSAAAFGASITVFYAAYALCEIPSNLALARFGARVWIARIMITWGLASAATAFAGRHPFRRFTPPMTPTDY